MIGPLKTFATHASSRLREFIAKTLAELESAPDVSAEHVAWLREYAARLAAYVDAERKELSSGTNVGALLGLKTPTGNDPALPAQMPAAARDRRRASPLSKQPWK